MTSRFRLTTVILACQCLWYMPSLAQAAPILLNSGDQVVFKFDLSPLDMSSVGTIQYRWETYDIADAGPFPFFEMRYRLYDELGDIPFFENPSITFSTVLTHNIANGVFPGLFDDPVSYIGIDFVSANGVIPSAVMMDMSATVFTGGDTSPVLARADGIPSIPVPASLPLVSFAAGILYVFCRKRA